MNRISKLWFVIGIGACLMVPFTVIYALAGKLDLISWGALILSGYLFFSDGFDLLRDGSEE